MCLNKNEYQVLLRNDLATFVERAFRELNSSPFYRNWHIDLIASTLEKCRRGQVRRLIINVPPRSLKSILVSIAFPAFLLGQNPSSQIICVSYGQDLSEKLARDCRSVMQSRWYKEIFTTRISSEKQAVGEFSTTKGGFRLSTSVGGQLTGRGGDYIIIDDPQKPDDALSESQRRNVNEWFDSTVLSRLNDKREGRIIVVQQRLHQDDLVGHLQEHGDWTTLRLPAIAEEDETHRFDTLFGSRVVQRKTGEPLHALREPLEVLRELRQQKGEYHFAAQYQQSPAPLGGAMVKIAWFKRYSESELPAKFDQVIQSWDTANKPTELNDYSVCTTWGIKARHVYLLNVHRKRHAYPDLKRAVRQQAEIFKPQRILIEDRASGTQLLQDLKNETVYALTGYQPKGDKILRMDSASSLIENGCVSIPTQAAWLDAFVDELQMFPNGKYDDQADSISQALDWIKSGMNRPAIIEFYKREVERMAEEGLLPDSILKQCGLTP